MFKTLKPLQIPPMILSLKSVAYTYTYCLPLYYIKLDLCTVPYVFGLVVLVISSVFVRFRLGFGRKCHLWVGHYFSERVLGLRILLTFFARKPLCCPFLSFTLSSSLSLHLFAQTSLIAILLVIFGLFLSLCVLEEVSILGSALLSQAWLGPSSASRCPEVAIVSTLIVGSLLLCRPFLSGVPYVLQQVSLQIRVLSF